jgi:pyruvate/2-oxoglutarate dehydrogenase complex dihydrolipoamide acyltransferase (E2) component
LAKANGLDINQITGTGKDGRITKEDVINYMEGSNIPYKVSATK